MPTDDYRVRLEAFEGPLDLLLFLIKRAEVDIHDIPIATITEQYLQFLEPLRRSSRIDIDQAGEFLVMAATLMEIKSRMLSSDRDEPDAEQARNGEDPRAELVQRLLEYRRYREASDALERRAEQWRGRFPVRSALVEDAALREALEAAGDLELDDLSLIDLVEAFRRIAETVDFTRLGGHAVTYDDTPIEVHAQDIMTQLRAHAEIEFRTLLEGRTRSEMLGLFLALLDLIRRSQVKVRQERVDGRIIVSMCGEDPAG
jgi:segregation and condensation protein A